MRLLPTGEERALLRESVRGFLAAHWPVADAVRNTVDAAALGALWRGLAAQGLTELGSNPEEGGLREICIVMEELGRAACPAPVLAAALCNLVRTVGDDGDAGLFTALQAGRMRPAFWFGALDGDASAGALRWDAGRVSGTLRFVDGAANATHLLIALDAPSALAVVDCAASGVAMTATRALGADGQSEVTLDAALARLIALPPQRLAGLALVARLARLARAHGAARRAFEMAVDYAKERQQFGKPIGSFQAVQHKLANCLIALEGVRLTLHHAAAQHDLEAPGWRYFASTALAFGTGALRRVSLETHHAFGAIGYAEEHEAPRHFRRTHLDTLGGGGVRAARAEVAEQIFARAGAALPRFDLGAAGNAFRDEVRAWLAANWSGARKAAFDAQPFGQREFDPSFARDIGSTGWIGLTWPGESGGQARSPLEQIAFIEEMERAEAPRIGASIQSTALMLFGTPAQRTRYLPEILAGEAMHGMGYSEPDAGSDLASLRTSAVRDGDEWVINGQKIWTTTYWGKYMFLAARTDAAAKPAHAGISMFIVPMDTPGISVKPSATMYDGTFANIFYDKVRVPADALLGQENGGWKVLTSALATERGLVGGGIVIKVAHAFELLCAEIRAATLDGKPMQDDALVRDRVALLAAEIEVGRQLMLCCAELAKDGPTPPEYGAISKVFSGELMERFGEAALELLGLRAALSQGASGNLANGKFEQGLRHSLMWVISIGTNEIQRSLIAQRGLGLPR